MAEGAAAQAKERRREQLRHWTASCTNQEAAEPRGQARAVRFDGAAEFLAACAGGDLEEAEAMLQGKGGSDLLNSTNVDGISALHQACIDENLEVLEFLVNHDADVNQADNEGWTPLHVAASCGYMEIAEYLLKHGANIAAVNCDGNVPVDIAEDDCMEALLRSEVTRIGIDLEQVKREEEEVMLQDARQWLNAGKIEDVQHPKTGASALHVAAAKGYIEVMRLLLQAGFDTNVQDKDGWTPLHAAAHWGVEEACRLLVENFCDMKKLNNVGQRPCDVADEDIVSLLEELQKKQEDMRSEKEAHLKLSVIDTNMEQQPMYTNKHRRMLTLAQVLPALAPGDGMVMLTCRMRISTSHTACPDITYGSLWAMSALFPVLIWPYQRSSGVHQEKIKKKVETNDNNALNGVVIGPPTGEVTPIPSSLKFTGGLSPTAEKDDSSLATWRAGLRKTGSFGVLQDAKLEDSNASEGWGIKRSASSPRLDSEEKSKEPRLARVQPTPNRRIFTVPETDSTRDGRRERGEGGLQMRFEPVPSTQMYTVPTSSTFFSSTTTTISSTTSSSTCTTTTTTSNSITSSTDLRDRRRSYQTPVRDEESESQRKARSRLMRQSRRSTQGVTLTDLKEAEKTVGRSVESTKASEIKNRDEDQREQGESDQLSEGMDLARRTRLPSTDTSSLSSHSHYTVNSLVTHTQAKKASIDPEGLSKEESESENRNRLAARDRRKGRRDRLLAGFIINTSEGEEDLETVNSDKTPGPGTPEHVNSLLPHRTGVYSYQRHNSTSGSRDEDQQDYKKLYEDMRTENENLKDQLQETELKLTQLKLELERVTQRHERYTERPALLELERFERRALERKAAELEEELKVLSDLKADNQRLKDENAALIRVISKLSK
ncbi:protein phosphatase 1 regulatory subunit 12C [Pleurodeles waltl]|uniref:protein phosphatase 1 regulatory subunit 12C n=1 Tax=Pleurodeles waltl TaxID=8319 RepID=UPI0037096E2A